MKGNFPSKSSGNHSTTMNANRPLNLHIRFSSEQFSTSDICIWRKSSGTDDAYHRQLLLLYGKDYVYVIRLEVVCGLSRISRMDVLRFSIQAKQKKDSGRASYGEQ